MKLKFKPTGIVFDLPELDVKRIIAEDKGNNYEILDKDKKIEKDNDKNILEELTVAELKVLCEDRGIEFAKNANKATLLKKLKELEK